MKFHGITLQEGSTVANMTLASGTSFPSNPNEGELFFRSDSDTSVRGMYAYIGGNWDRLASADALTVPSAANFPSTANVGDLFYKDSNDINEALYVYNGSSWVATGNSGGTSTVDGDLSGTISIGGTSTLTLDTVASAGTSGSASKTVTVTIDAKGRVTSLVEQDVAIAASQVTSGTFADARIAQSNVTQHQAAISVAASQVTSGTFADARVAQSNVTQHQAALTIAETQITNGSVLARVADNENISGNWAFNGTVSGQTPTNGAHLVTKDYADALATGLDFKQSVKAATTTNITLSGSQTIDGVAISAGMRVLVKDQTDGTQNGIYVAAAGAWTRAADADNTPSNEVTSGMFCYVEEGTVNADSGWVLATNDVITLGSTNLVFTQFTGLGQITAGNGLTKSGNTINVGGTAGRIVVNVDDIDLATVTDSGTGSFKKISVDSYGRVTGTTDVVSSDITSLVDSTYVNVAGDTMTGLLTISRTGNGLVVASTDSTPANNSGIILNTTANATASSRVATIVLDANGADGAGGDYVTLNAFGSGDFTINNRSAAAITFQTNTTERMRIDSSGNIGIGTTPTFFVHAKQDANASVVGQIENASAGAAANARWIASNGTNSIGIQITGTGNTTPNIASLYASGATTPLTFATNGAERVRIDSSGNVSIGTSSASGKLDVSATDPSTYITRYVAGAGGANIYLRHSRSGSVGTNTILNSGDTIGTLVFAGANGTSYGDSAYIQVQVDGTPSATAMPGRLIFSTSTTASSTPTERMRIDSAGNVGVGTTPNSTYKLHVQSTGSNQVASQGTTDASFITNVNGTQSLYLHSTATMSEVNELRAVPLLFTVNGAERARIDASGNLGLGVTPSAWRSVTKAIQVNRSALADLSSGAGTALGNNWYENTSGVDAYIGNNTASVYYQTNGIHRWYSAPSGTAGATITWTPSMTLDANGNLGIGMTPSTKLDVGGSARANWFGMNTAGAPSGIGTGMAAPASDTLALYTNTAERMRIDASGNVGVGLTSPTNKLDVNGTVGFWASGTQIGSAFNDSLALNLQANTNATAGLKLGTSGATPVVAYTNGAERMRIDANGNVGIGQTPTTFNRFSTASSVGITANGTKGTMGEVFANTLIMGIRANSYYDTGATAIKATAAGYSPEIQLRTDTGAIVFNRSTSVTADTTLVQSESMRIDASGNVGIGTSAPVNNGRTLTVSNSGTGVAALYLQNATSGGSLTDGLNVTFDSAQGGYVWNYENLPLIFGTNNTERLRIDASGNVLVTGSGGLGYGTGSGGTVTQATSKATGVTLNKSSGQITTSSAALAANTTVAFVLTNSTIGANDVVNVLLKSGNASGAGTYQVWAEGTTAGTCVICIRNITGGSLSEALVLNFVVIKGATS